MADLKRREICAYEVFSIRCFSQVTQARLLLLRVNFLLADHLQRHMFSVITQIAVLRLQALSLIHI